MSPWQSGHTRNKLDPERVAYWYFRLNGFLQIENFVVHPEKKGSARTDADLIGVRFPHREEGLYDDRPCIMEDDSLLELSDLVEVIIAEVKTGQCSLNPAWTESHRQNIHRILAAIGCIPKAGIPDAATNLYRLGVHTSDGLRIRSVAIGRERNPSLNPVTQIVWSDILGFIWDRLREYRRQKTDTRQWDEAGHDMKRLERTADRPDFIRKAIHFMGVVM